MSKRKLISMKSMKNADNRFRVISRIAASFNSTQFIQKASMINVKRKVNPFMDGWFPAFARKFEYWHYLCNARIIFLANYDTCNPTCWCLSSFKVQWLWPTHTELHLDAHRRDVGFASAEREGFLLTHARSRAVGTINAMIEITTETNKLLYELVNDGRWWSFEVLVHYPFSSD